MWYPILITVLVGYMLGNLNGAITVSALMKDDVRSHGSGNAGLTNFIRNYGAKSAVYVILIDAGGFTERAIFGELMATYCKIRGVRGIVCDGAVRDAESLAAMEDFPVYARAVTPNGPYKNGPGEINVPVVIGGKVVCPGDIVVGDGDGVLFIRPEHAAQLAEATRAVGQKEAAIMQDILEKGTYIRPWVDDLLKKINCEIL